MQKKQHSPRQYIATGIIGICAIISSLFVIYQKNVNNYSLTARTTSTTQHYQTLKNLCLVEQDCSRNELHETCMCK